jgi:glucoamylase
MLLLAAGALAAAVVSGGTPADPRTPPGLPGLPPPFLGTMVVGSGGLTAAIDAYGDVVDLRPAPAGSALIDNPADRQAAGTVAVETGIVPRVSLDGGAALPFWRADSVKQRYLPGSNVVRTVARFGRTRVALTDAATGGRLTRIAEVETVPPARAAIRFDVEAELDCEQRDGPRRVVMVCASIDPYALAAERIACEAAAQDRGWIARARPLASAAPRWAKRMFQRSLLTLHALTARRTGAAAAGARDGWAYVWPRDAGAVALAFAAGGYRPEARRVARFLLGLDLRAAARFHGDGTPAQGREAQGDAAGWVAVAARATGLPSHPQSLPWRDRPDYQERDQGTHLANAIASVAAEPPADGPISRPTVNLSSRRPGVDGVVGAFGTPRGLTRRAKDPPSGLDSAAAWAVRPFSQPALYPVVRRTLLRLAANQTRFGITPGEGWGGIDPWTAPTAWTAWSLAALGERRAALSLLGDLRRASTAAGALPERVDAHIGVPRSTTPLAWSHAFAILALRQLWP